VISGVLFLAAFLGAAWLLFRLVDLCYRHALAEPEQRTPAGPAPVEPPRSAPERSPVLTRP
jgi:hypothetical protein